MTPTELRILRQALQSLEEAVPPLTAMASERMDMFVHVSTLEHARALLRAVLANPRYAERDQ